MHQVRPTNDGAEMRSRFWLGHPQILRIPSRSVANPRAATVTQSGPGRAALTPVLPRLGARLANATMAP